MAADPHESSGKSTRSTNTQPELAKQHSGREKTFECRFLDVKDGRESGEFDDQTAEVGAFRCPPGSAPFCEHAPPRSSAEAATAPPLAPLAHEHEDSPAGTERRRQTARCELYGPLLSGVGMRIARFAGVMSRSFALILNLCAHILTRCPSWCGLACMFSFSAAEQAELPGRNQVVVSLREEQ